MSTATGRPPAGTTGTGPPRRAARHLVAVLLVGLATLLAPSVATAAVAGELTDPTPGAAPRSLAPAPDGTLWFTDAATGRIGRVGPTGVFQGFSSTPAGLPSAAAVSPDRIALGPDGALWFTTPQGGIVRITTAGVATRYTGRTTPVAAGIAAGPDGALWFTVPGADAIGRITAPTDDQVAAGAARGQITTYPQAAGSAPDDIVLGEDGALWFTEPGLGRLGRAVPGPQGPVVGEVAVPTPGGAPSRLTTGPDGRIWFSAPGTRTIGRIGSDGRVVELPLPAGSGVPGDVASAPDGALWFVETGGPRDALGRIDTAGQVSRFELPDPQGGVVELVRGADGTLRYTRAGGRIGRVDVLQPTPGPPVAPPAPPTPTTPLPPTTPTTPTGPPRALAAQAGRAVVLEAVSGTILVRRPGSTVFRPLAAGGALLPDGTEVDARRGRVRLIAETAPGSGITRAAIFWDGRFVVRQARTAGAFTEVRLSGPLVCSTAAQTRAKKRRKGGRRLWGDGEGDFRSRGSRATASVRGTRWLTEDRCDRTTRVRVFEGTVVVRDRVRNRRVRITGGEQYVAPGPRRRR